MFKNWIVDGKEFEEGHKLVITKDVEVKANWEDVKVNPVKKALSSLFSKEDKEELDIGNININDAVMEGDNTTEGDPEGTVTSKDGKTRITNFEAHWVGTDEDTVLGTTLDGGYTTDKYLGWDTDYYYGKVVNYNNTKLQVKYVISGERLYAPGTIKIKLPYRSRAKEYPESYVEASNIPMPEAKIIDDKIDYNADYGKAEYVYYIDGDDLIITNTTAIPAATSGTFLIDYFFPNKTTGLRQYKGGGYRIFSSISDDIRNMPDMYKFEVDSQISIDINGEEGIFKNSRRLYHQVNKTVSGDVLKDLVYIGTGSDEEESELFIKGYKGYYPEANRIVDWQPEWGDNLKPKNYKDYYYMVYRIEALVGSVYSNASLKIEDILGENQGQKIIGYQFGDEGKYTKELGTRFLPYLSLKEEDEEFELNKFGPTGYYGKHYSNVKYMYLLVSFKKDILKDQKPHQFTNTAKITIRQLNSEDNPIIKTDEEKNHVKYVPLPPKAEFTAPPGNKFSLNKYIGYRDRARGYMTITKPADKSEYIRLSGLVDDALYASNSWSLSGTVEALSETYDPAFGEKDNLDAYKRKTYTAELVDDYLYTGNDYKRELKSEDYEVNGVYLNTRDYDYKRISRTEIGYVWGYHDSSIYGKDGVTYPSKLYGRKESTGKWKEIASFDFIKTSDSSETVSNFTSKCNVKKLKSNYIEIPAGFTSIKWEIKTNRPKVEMIMNIDATLKPSDYVQKMFKQNETSPGNSKIRIRNDGTIKVINNEGQTIGIPSTTKRDKNNSRTFDLDLENYKQEMYHDTAYWDITIKTPEDKVFEQKLTKNVNKFYDRKVINNHSQKIFIVPALVYFKENVKNDNGISLREYDSGTFYDLLPLGVSGVKNLAINGTRYVDRETRSKNLNLNYELIENWQNTGRTLLIAKYNNAELVIPDKIKNSDKPYLGEAESKLYLSYDMVYPWDSYKDYGGKLYNFVAFESGKDSMESGLPDLPNFEEKTEHHKIANKALKNLNKDNNNKNFLYAMDETIVSGNTSANTGLTKHIKDSKDPKYSLATKTREGGQYSYRIRMQSLSGTTTSGLIFYDSIENYNPLKTDEDYGVKRWRGTLENIDLSHARMRGADPKVYVSTLEGLNMQESKDITDTNIWKPYKEGDDLSKVHAIAVDLRHRPDGSEFKLKEEESVNITLNMKAPWNLKEKQIDPQAKALNEIYANTTITTDLNNQSTNKLINTAYTAIELEPVKTEINLNANKKYLDREGQDIDLKGNDFTFELKDAEGKVLQTKTNDNKGNITFDPIKYNSWDAGEHIYKIVEVKGDNAKIAYDSHEEIVKVEVERVGDSELKATVSYDDDGPNFLNQDKKSASLKIIKKEAGTNKLLEGAEYLLSKKNDKAFAPVKLITNENGESQIIEDLETGTYMLKETKAPKGCRLNTEEIEFEITDNDLGTVVVKEVEDKPKADMPTTGTSGKVFFAITINLIALAGIGTYKRKMAKKQLTK